MILNSVHPDIRELLHQSTLFAIPSASSGHIIVRALSRENLSSGFATRVDSNRPVQPQKLGRDLKFQIYKLEIYSLDSEQKQVFSWPCSYG